jgi:hypothetical protein
MREAPSALPWCWTPLQCQRAASVEIINTINGNLGCTPQKDSTSLPHSESFDMISQSHVSLETWRFR